MTAFFLAGQPDGTDLLHREGGCGGRNDMALEITEDQAFELAMGGTVGTCSPCFPLEGET